MCYSNQINSKQLSLQKDCFILLTIKTSEKLSALYKRLTRNIAIFWNSSLIHVGKSSIFLIFREQCKLSKKEARSLTLPHCHHAYFKWCLLCNTCARAHTPTHTYTFVIGTSGRWEWKPLWTRQRKSTTAICQGPKHQSLCFSLLLKKSKGHMCQSECWLWN